MAQVDVARAWKDAEYRAGLSAEELAQLPASPVGMVELSDGDLEAVGGGYVMPMTITGGCSYSYETRPSCGHFCTITYECGCSAQQADASVSVD